MSVLLVGIGATTDAFADAQTAVAPHDASSLAARLPVEVQVQAARATERIEARAEAVRVVEIPSTRPVELAEVLARTEGIAVSRAGALGSGAQLAIAGLGGEKIRFFLDGVPLELAGYPGGIATVPSGLIERAEIYQGVVPARFSADALGGVVSLVSERLTNGHGASLSYEQGAFGTHRLAVVAARRSLQTRTHQRIEAYFDRADNDYPVDVTVPDAQGRLTSAKVHRFHDAYRALGIALESGLSAGRWADKLVVRTYAGFLEKELQHNLTMTVPYGDAEYGKLHLGSVVRYAKQWEHGFGLQGYIGFTRRDTTFRDVGRCAYDWFGRCVRELPQPGEIGSSATHQRVIQRDVISHFELTKQLGESVRVNWANSPSWLARDGSNRLGGSTLDNHPIEEPRRAQNLTSSFGLELKDGERSLSGSVFAKGHVQRVAAAETLADASSREVRRERYAWGVGATLRKAYREVLWAKASYEWATRMPGGDEWFGDGVLVQPNLSIRPERSHNVNLTLGLQAKAEAYGTAFLEATAYVREATDLIVLLGNDTYFTHQNVLAARIRGIEARSVLQSAGGRLKLQSNVTLQDVRNASEDGAFAAFKDDRIPNRPHLLANLSPSFRTSGLLTPSDELELSWHSRYVHAFFRSWEGLGDPAQKQSIPSQLLHALSLSYMFQTELGRVTQALEVQNLTNERSFDFYGMQRPGRAAYAKWTVQL